MRSTTTDLGFIKHVQHPFTPHQASNPNNYGRALLSVPSQAIAPNPHSSHQFAEHLDHYGNEPTTFLNRIIVVQDT
jgi:hypothetical protein